MKNLLEKITNLLMLFNILDIRMHMVHMKQLDCMKIIGFVGIAEKFEEKVKIASINFGSRAEIFYWLLTTFGGGFWYV